MQPYTLITGASRGIGLALAHKLAALQTPLILAARDAAALKEHAQALSNRYTVAVQTIASDLSTQEGVDALIAQCAPFTLSGLVNNAGFGLGGAFIDEQPQALCQMLFLNMQATTQLSRHFLPQLVAHKGILINVASQAAFQAMPYFAAYAASKAYVLHLTEALHHELKPSGVRVLALCPGATATDFFNRAHINTQNTYLKLGSVDTVVDAAFKALNRGEAFVIPGAGNKAATFVQRFISRGLGVKISAQLMRRKKA